jgi:ArsR family transcriptional regulator
MQPKEAPVTTEQQEVEILCCPPLAEHALSEGEATRLAGVLAALADPVRLRIFSIIASQDETCSCNLEGPLAKSQPTISHHTRKLVEAGLIVGEKRGRWTWWRAVPEQLAALGAALGVAERTSA